MRSTLLLFFAGLVVFSSCVPNRKFLYLQHGNEFKKKKDPKDTVLRTYKLEDFDYKVQPNDILSVRFQSLTAKEFDFMVQQSQASTSGVGANAGGSALTSGELVDDKGEIPIPVLGLIKVAGKTVFQIQDTLQYLANLYLESPIVKVRLLNYRVTFLGEVGKEGAVILGNNRVSLMEAIGQAGGLSELADRSNIKIIRQKGSKTEVFYVNVLKEGFMTSPYYYVYQNDLIIVPPLKQRTLKFYTQNIALFLSSVSLLLFVLTLSKK